MNELAFTKYQGTGNDFVILDRTAGGARITAAQAAAICDRHFGVGADGVLTLYPATGAALGMHIFNADGSEAEMCGNGIRCAAKHAIDFGLAKGDAVEIETAGGVMRCAVERDAGGKVAQVTVDMGKPELAREKIGVAGTGRMIRETIQVEDRSFEFTAVSMGNPHVVTFGDGLATLALARRYGPLIENDTARFPNRTNVEFAQIRDGGIDLVVWERGSGITLACGTGACATATAAVLVGLAPAGTELEVRLPGGPLGITIEPDLARAHMRGPAQLVFHGDLSRALLAG